MESDVITRISAFSAEGFKKTIAELMAEVELIYCSDDIPWIIGYSGGKDSTAILQLIWNTLLQMPPEKRTKQIYVISTDTLVENPIVAQWVKKSLEIMANKAAEQKVPIIPQRLVPEVKDRFWVNLIGKGYPAPRPKFRWCTSRLKIAPSNTFIKNMERQNGEAILVLGTRKAESSARAASMTRHENSTRNKLNRHGDFDRVWVYTPIGTWSNDDVWQFLMQVKNPWGYNNKDLLGMYQGATADGECPLVVDSNTPSCGDSRFGCYVCTMVSQDKSMKAMIQNDNEKEWMLPLLELRDKYLNIENDSFRREFWRMDGKLTVMTLATRPTQDDPFTLFRYSKVNELQIDVSNFVGISKYENYSEVLHKDQLIGKQPVIEAEYLDDGKWITGYYKLVHGPYTQEYRALLLGKLLSAQKMINEFAPEEIRFEVVSDEDLEAIRREWVLSKHEIDDLVPRIYEDVLNKPYPFKKLDDSNVFNSDDINLLHELANEMSNGNQAHFKVIRELIAVELKHQHASRRAGLSKELNHVLEYGAFESEIEALNFAVRKKISLDKSQDKPSSEISYIRPKSESKATEEIHHAF
jgi:DNA sulfur modification protein DndC